MIRRPCGMEIIFVAISRKYCHDIIMRKRRGKRRERKERWRRKEEKEEEKWGKEESPSCHPRPRPPRASTAQLSGTGSETTQVCHSPACDLERAPSLPLSSDFIA